MPTFIVSISDKCAQRVVPEYQSDHALYQVVHAETAKAAIEIACYGHILTEAERIDNIMSSAKFFGEVP